MLQLRSELKYRHVTLCERGRSSYLGLGVKLRVKLRSWAGKNVEDFNWLILFFSLIIIFFFFYTPFSNSFCRAHNIPVLATPQARLPV